MHLLDIHDGMVCVYEKGSLTPTPSKKKTLCLHGFAKRQIVCRVDDFQWS